MAMSVSALLVYSGVVRYESLSVAILPGCSTPPVSEGARPAENGSPDNGTHTFIVIWRHSLQAYTASVGTYDKHAEVKIVATAIREYHITLLAAEISDGHDGDEDAQRCIPTAIDALSVHERTRTRVRRRRRSVPSEQAQQLASFPLLRLKRLADWTPWAHELYRTLPRWPFWIRDLSRPRPPVPSEVAICRTAPWIQRFRRYASPGSTIELPLNEAIDRADQ